MHAELFPGEGSEWETEDRRTIQTHLVPPLAVVFRTIASSIAFVVASRFCRETVGRGEGSDASGMRSLDVVIWATAQTRRWKHAPVGRYGVVFRESHGTGTRP